MKVVALAGGTGSAKLLIGLSKLPIDLSVIANPGDNVWMYGVYVCPDIDIACYSLAGIADKVRGWGVQDDTFETLASLSRLGLDTWFKLGDRDFATCLARTTMIRRGLSLTAATKRIRILLGVKQEILPATDEPLETRIRTERGESHLQEFWVRDHGKPRVRGVRYEGSKAAKVSEDVGNALAEADKIVVCPANPITSIGPMLAVPGFSDLLARARSEVVAVSPMEGKAPFSGPALKLMKAEGIRSDSLGVAKLYSRFLDRILISKRDAAMKKEIDSIGVSCTVADIRMKTDEDQTRLAGELLRT